MKNFIELNSLNYDAKVLINIDKIIYIETIKDGCFVTLFYKKKTPLGYFVQESLNEIMQKIEEC